MGVTRARVRFLTIVTVRRVGLGIGTWAQRAVFNSNHVFALKQSSSALPAEAAAALTPVCAASQILGAAGACEPQ